MIKTRFRTVIIGITLLGLLLLVPICTQADEEVPQGIPFQKLQEQIDALKAHIETITGIVNENVANIDSLQEELEIMESLRVSAKKYRYAVVSNADCGPFPECEFVDVFETPLTITTTITGPMIITFSAECDMKGGNHPSVGYGQMLMNVQLDGQRQEPGEVWFLNVGRNESDSGVCSYAWEVSDVPAGTHTVQANFRILDGYEGGFARVLHSTMWVIHER